MRVCKILPWLILLWGASGAAWGQKELIRTDLVQPFLSDEYSQWMMGAVGHIATDDEISRFLALDDESEAKAFVEEFWRKRSESTDGASVRELFEGRARQADREYTEGHIPGRRTDRGTVYILYGPPVSVEYEEFRDVSEPEVELWKYSKKAPRGLDGEKPRRNFRFARQGDVTRQYRPPTEEELRRRARMRKPY